MGQGFRRHVEMLLKNSLGASKVVLKFGLPPVEITFDKSEILAIIRSSEIVSRTIAHCFVERRAFWEDATRENYNYVVDSLVSVESLLREFDQNLVATNDAATIGCARLVRAWRLRVVETRKQLVDQIAAINKDKAEDPFYDSAGEDRHDAMIKTLIDLRVRVYPLITSMIDMIDDGDPVKNMAEEKMDLGLRLLTPRQIRGIEPEIELQL